MQDSVKQPLIKLSFPLIHYKALIFSQIMAVIWWLIALYAESTGAIPVWYDQKTIFLKTLENIANPYVTVRFANPPWVGVILAPFNLLPLHVATLLQLGLSFGLLTAVLYQYGGNFRTVVITLTTFITFHTTIELNLEWITYIGLLCPALISPFFLGVKPQSALCVYLSFSRRDFIQAVIGGLIVLLVSFLIWGGWPLLMQQNVVGYILQQPYNIAPSALLSWPVSFSIGFYLAWRGFKKRDPVLCILAWLFFTPYTTFYSLLLPCGLLTIRYPRFVLLVSGIMWVIYGSVLVRALIFR